MYQYGSGKGGWRTDSVLWVLWIHPVVVSIKTMEHLGVGLYTPAEAARYAKLHQAAVTRWLFPGDRHEPVFTPRLKKDAHIVTFPDFIQLLAVRRARADQISLQKIRQAIERAQKNYNVDFPLAYKHSLVYFDNELHIELYDNEIVQLTGEHPGQGLIRQIIEPFMKRIEFSDDGMAERFTLFTWSGRNVVMDPEIQFGQPLVAKTGYPADVLVAAYLAEGSSEAAAAAYGVDEADIETAIAFNDDFQRLAA